MNLTTKIQYVKGFMTWAKVKYRNSDKQMTKELSDGFEEALNICEDIINIVINEYPSNTKLVTLSLKLENKVKYLRYSMMESIR